LNGRWVTHFAPTYGASWLADPRFLVGAALFLAGFVINIQSDTILMNLRKPGETGYKVPQGGLYRWLSCPNYFGELVEWTGWAIATWSLPGLAFAIWTAANLVPRARTNHQWYREKFPDYPRERRAVLPLLY
jgi:steroid 5-alpha reductase family enzyme